VSSTAIRVLVYSLAALVIVGGVAAILFAFRLAMDLGWAR
jgi:uncharacterized membrane protein HdeD (DUF308 family)